MRRLVSFPLMLLSTACFIEGGVPEDTDDEDSTGSEGEDGSTSNTAGSSNDSSGDGTSNATSSSGDDTSTSSSGDDTSTSSSGDDTSTSSSGDDTSTSSSGNDTSSESDSETESSTVGTTTDTDGSSESDGTETSTSGTQGTTGETGDTGDTGGPDVLVTSPNGGETWSPGTQQSVTWSGGSGSTVDIELWRGGALLETIATATANDGQHDWVIPGTVPNADDLRVRIVASGSQDDSDADFRIAAWRYRTQIDVVNADSSVHGGEALALMIDSTAFDTSTVNDEASDLRFSTSSDQTDAFDLPYWIQSWNPTGISWVWVQAPDIAATTTLPIYMFHGNEFANTQADMNAVFTTAWVSSGDSDISGTQEVDLFWVQAGHVVTATSHLNVFAHAVIIDGTMTASGMGGAGGIGRVGSASDNGSGSGGGIAGVNEGGGGGGYGGIGGASGCDTMDAPCAAGGATYGNTSMSFAAAPGSGGGAGHQPSGAVTAGNGGAGGGSIGLQGAGRILVSSTGVLEAHGIDGDDANAGGGGGSGGKLTLLGNYISILGSVGAHGGRGGDQLDAASDAGGGGGGGRVVASFGQGIVPAGPTIDVAGGAAGTNGTNTANAPVDGGAGTTTSASVTMQIRAEVGATTTIAFRR